MARVQSLNEENHELKVLLKEALRFVQHAQWWATGSTAQRFREKHDAVGLVTRIEGRLKAPVVMSTEEMQQILR